MEYVIESRKLTKYFYDPAKIKVLHEVDVCVQAGEFVTIVGKSGCGKSTLLYLLSTMDTDYEGQVYLRGELLTGKSEGYLAHMRNKHIGFVFQFHYLLNEFTVLQNVMLPALKLNEYGPKRIKEKAEVHLKTLGIAHLAHKRAHLLSGGEKQRVAIARALINDPAIIMGDEPTGNLDSKNTEIVFDTFDTLSKNYGQSLLIVTHDNAFARRSQRIIEMEDGRVLRSGSTTTTINLDNS